MSNRILLVVCALVFTGCDLDAQRQINALTEENEDLQLQLHLSTEYIEDITAIMDQVQDNLNRIERREGIISRISLNDSETNRVSEAINVREELITSINDIDGYLRDNRLKIEQLNQRISASNVRITSLERLVDNLTTTVYEKEKSAARLKERVRLLESEISELQLRLASQHLQLEERDERILAQNETIRQREAEIRRVQDVLETAHYVLGTRGQLRELGVIHEKRSGFLGLKKKIRLGSIETDNFESVSKSTQAIPLAEKREDIHVLSVHKERPDLYSFASSEDGFFLAISDPEAFWALSEYLVLELDG